MISKHVFAHVKRISPTHIQLITLASTIIVLQSATHYFLFSKSPSNIFSKVLLESLITLILSIARCIKSEEKIEEFNILENVNALVYFSQLSAVLFSISVLSSTLKNYYSRVLIVSLKTLEIPLLDIKSIIKNGTNSIKLKACGFQGLGVIVHYVFIIVLTAFSVHHCSPIGILIFILFIVVLTVKQKYRTQIDLISHTRSRVTLKASEVIITFPFFLLFGNINDIMSYKNIVKASLNTISSMCFKHILTIIRQEYNKVYIHTCIAVKMFKILKVCIRSEGISVLQLGALIPLIALFYVRSIKSNSILENKYI